jgi:23S rRNA (pseudouridine1915-N3)-methyltransferase
MTELTLAAILRKRTRAKSDQYSVLLDRYTDRAAKYLPTASAVFESEDALFAFAARQPSRAAAHILLFDPRGQLLTSEDFARLLGKLRDDGVQRVLLAIGPPDGWSDAARARAAGLLSFGRVTLPHELARVVAAEQIYRALTILAGHPYHSGH